ATLVADYATVLHALVLAAQTLPVRHRAKDARAEQPVALRLEGTVVEGFGLGDFAVRPAPDFFRRGQTDANGVKVRDHICHFEWARTKQGVPPLPAVLTRPLTGPKPVASGQWSVTRFLAAGSEPKPTDLFSSNLSFSGPSGSSVLTSH